MKARNKLSEKTTAKMGHLDGRKFTGRGAVSGRVNSLCAGPKWEKSCELSTFWTEALSWRKLSKGWDIK